MGQAVEDAGANALGCNQVELGIDPGEHPAGLADLAASVPREIAERLQYQADLVEVVGDGVATRVHPGLQSGAFALQPLRSFGPPQMRFAVRAAVAGMAPHGGAKSLELSLGVWIASGLTVAHWIKVNLAEPGTQRSSQIPPRGGLLRVEVLADLHPATHQRWCGKVSDRQPPDLAVLSEHQRSRRLMILTHTRVDDHRPALALPARHSDDVTRLQDRQCLQRLGAAVRPPLSGGRGLQIGKLCP